MKRILGIIVGVAVSLACLAYAMRGVSWEELKVGFANANYLTLPLMLAFLFAFYWLKAVRWAWLLTPIQPFTGRQLMPPLLIGFAANNVLPAHLGEFVRVFVVNRKFGLPATTVLSTVVLERIFDVLAILALFGIGRVPVSAGPGQVLGLPAELSGGGREAGQRLFGRLPGASEAGLVGWLARADCCCEAARKSLVPAQCLAPSSFE